MQRTWFLPAAASTVLYGLTLVGVTQVGAAAPASAIGIAPAAAVTVGAAGFTDTVVASIASPTALAFTPDGRMLVTEDTGQLRVIEDGHLLTPPALSLGSRVCAGGERGLLGIAVDPKFAANRFIYLYWSHNAHDYCGQTPPNTPENRVSRYVLGADNKVVSGSEKILIDHIPSQRINHNAGDLHFGANQLLYVSVGDGGCVLNDATRCGALNTNSRRLDIPNGKILRIT